MNKKLPKRNWIKTPTVFQMEATECGAASLSMVLGYFGCFISMEQLRIDCGVSRDGCNAKNVKRAGIKYGLNVKAYSKSFVSMLELKPPLILHWNFNHFVVYEGCKNGHIYINDPAIGRRELSYDDVDDCFTGIVLSFEVGEGFQKTEKSNDLFKLLSQRLMRNRKEIGALLAAGLVLVFPGIVIPVFSQIFVDDILAAGNTHWLGALLLAMIGTVLFQAFFIWLKTKVLLQLQLKLKLFSSYEFLSHMFKLPIVFFEQRYAGDLSQRVENNNSVNNFLAGDFSETLLNVFVAVCYLVILIFYNPILTLIGVVGVAVNLIVALTLSKSLEDLSTKSKIDQGSLTGKVYSGIWVSETLKASGAESLYTTRVLGDYAKYIESDQKISRVAVLLSNVPGAVTNVFDVIVLMIGGLLVIKGQITAGILVGFSELLGSFTAPVNALVNFFDDLQTKKADMCRVNDIEKYDVAPQFKEDRIVRDDKRVISGNVELRNVSFGYSPLEPPLIEDFSFKLETGKTIAIVGASGSGKSTVGKLVSGLNDPWSGEILIDGIPLRQIPVEVFTSSVATVSQSISLFACSVRDNLSLWNPFANEKNMINAAKDASIHNTITKHNGAYDFVMDEGGSNFSGGQRQRLEIARALSSNPRILVLDEATSALDAIVEQEIMQNIKKRGCTCIIVAHRLSTIRDADEIIVMDRGKIVQRGTHEEMCFVDGPYRQLINAE